MFEWITGVVSTLGYFGVAGLTFLENLFPPIPSELVIPLAGFVAARGELRLDMVIVSGSLGSLAGALLYYEIGRRIGEQRLRTWVERHGRWLTLSPRDLDRAAGWFERHGRVALLIGRLVPGVRTFISLPAGFARMPLVPFLLYSTLGTVAWTTALASAGVVLQSQFTVVADYIDAVANALLIGLGAMLLWRYLRCWRESRQAAA